MRIKILLASLILPTLFSCSMAPERSNYDLERFGDLLVSNSETSQSSPKKLGDGKVEIHYTLLVRNVAVQVDYVLHNDRGSFVLGAGAPQPFQCNKGVEFTLLKGTAMRLDCLIVLKADADNHLNTRDVRGKLTIPYTAITSAAAQAAVQSSELSTISTTTSATASSNASSSASSNSQVTSSEGQIDFIYQLRLEDFR